MSNSTEAPAVLGPVQRQVRPHAPVAEVVCYVTPRYMKPPMQTYELRQFDGFRELPPGTHQLYTEPADDRRPLWDYEIDRFWMQRLELHDGHLLPQLRDFARAIERAHGIAAEGDDS